MPRCPKCGAEVSETDNFCWRCGTPLRKTVPATPENAIKSIIIARIDGIRNKNPKMIRETIDEENYTKFDDWPPFNRQGLDGLKREADALRVLKEYNYEIKEWKINLFDDAAVASFIITYSGQIRNRRFHVKSRVSMFLIKRDGEWKIVHEHWSRFPEYL